MREYTALPHEYLDEMDVLTDEEFGRLVRALLQYSITGEEADLPGNEKLLWKRVRNREDRYKAGFDEVSAARSAAGSAGASARWNKQNDSKRISNNSKNSKRIFAIFDDGKNGYTDTNTETNTNTNTDNKPPKSPKGDGFERFWAAYPKKVGKQAAKKAWSKVNKDLTEVILQAVEYQTASKQGQEDGGRYIPNPTTWLNQGRWDDELEPAPQDKSVYTGYTLGNSELSAIARLKDLRDELAGGAQCE